MIVYQATKTQFLEDSFKHDIQDVIGAAYHQRSGAKVSPSEVRSWRESLMYMAKVLNDDGIPADSGVAIEYHIPQTSKRVDFILTGRGGDDRPNVVIVELKQWAEAKRTTRDAIVRTRFSGGEAEVTHPSYQAWSYAALLQGFNEAVYDHDVQLQPCAYLHNYERDQVIDHEFYQHHIEKAPLFLKGEIERNKLRDFIKQYVKFGDNSNLIYQIENGRIRPSKMLVDSLVRMIKGNQEFILVDDQKVVYETSLAAARKASDADKQVVIVEGGPGTGKSVVAINLLVALSKEGFVCKYVSKNAAPRSVYESKLTGVLRKTEISNLFSGSGAFTASEDNCFDALIVDEAHRLNEKSGLYGNLGEHQIKEIISAAKCTIMFVDDDQRVTLKDVGEKSQIQKWAVTLGAETTELELASQFRCNGSDGYLAWLDNTLGIRTTANDKLDVNEFDFRVVDSPQELHSMIEEKNRVNNKSRVVAGYCWNWVSKKSPSEYDIVIEEHNYMKRWNLASDGSRWIVAPDSIDEVGCIHTCQGLELDYVGVIVGPDLIVRDGEVVSQPDMRARSDKSLSGYKKMAVSQPELAQQQADQIIKNTYRTLMTRGMKGCYVYCTDSEIADFLRSRLIGVADRVDVACPEKIETPTQAHVTPEKLMPFKRLIGEQVRPYVNAVPLVDLKFAAGTFGPNQALDPDSVEWIVPPDWVKPQEGLFIAQVIGESMNRRIPNGAWCLFKTNPKGSRNGKIVVAEHRSMQDPDLGGSYAVKIYRSEKSPNEESSWEHTSIVLEPDSYDTSFLPIRIMPRDVDELHVIAEFIALLS